MNLNLAGMLAPALLTEFDGQNLFNEAWTTGNLYSIQPVVNVLGTLAVWVISAVGFFIIIFSILKNAMSGLYVVNPSFWDRVDELKTQAVDGLGGTIQETLGNVPGRGNYAASKLGGLLTWLLGIIPNIKALTDFDDADNIDKKQYFLRSIPLLVAQVFIGMLIFMGYPMKIAKWVGSGATYTIDAIIKNVDPIEVVQKVSDKIYIANLTTDGSGDVYDQFINKSTRTLMSSIITKYNDAQKQPIQNAALQLENQLIQGFGRNDVEAYVGEGANYDLSYRATVSNFIPTPSNKGFNQLTNSQAYLSTSSSGDFTMMTWVNGANIDIGSTKASSDDYFVLTIHGTPVAAKNTSSVMATAPLEIDTANKSADTQGRKAYAISNPTFGTDPDSLHGVLGKTVTLVLSDGSTTTGTLEAKITGSAKQNAQLVTNADLSKTGLDRILLPDGYSITLTNSGNKGSTVSVKVGDMKKGQTTWVINNVDIGKSLTVDTAKMQQINKGAATATTTNASTGGSLEGQQPK